VLVELDSDSPVVLHRNSTDFKITANQMNVCSGIEIQVKTDRKDLHRSLYEMDQGSWVIFEVPGFTKADSGRR
jgi:hypothetical protein